MIDFLTSDFVGYGLLILLIIALGIMAYWLLSDATNHIRVSRFFCPTPALRRHRAAV